MATFLVKTLIKTLFFSSSSSFFDLKGEIFGTLGVEIDEEESDSGATGHDDDDDTESPSFQRSLMKRFDEEDLYPFLHHVVDKYFNQILLLLELYVVSLSVSFFFSLDDSPNFKSLGLSDACLATLASESKAARFLSSAVKDESVK